MHDNVPDSLTCSICSQKFNNSTKQPRLLLCFHTFCEECLEKLATTPNPPSTQKSIACPLCSKVTPFLSVVVSLPINYALKDIVEASAATSQDKLCELHDESHPATYWCFDCEQGMCNDAHSTHSKAKGTKSHQTSKIGTSPQVIQKQVLCCLHNKELEFVCTDTTHSALMVCISCIATSHKSHPWVIASDYFKEKVCDGQVLLETAKALETKLTKGAEIVNNECAAIAGNHSEVKLAVNLYFSKIQQDVENHRNRLLTQLSKKAADKEKTLQTQGEGILASLNGIQKASQTLKLVLEDNNSQAKALAIILQLQQNLKTLEDINLQPQELAGLGFHETSFVLPEVYLIDATADATVESTQTYFPIVLTTKFPANRFEISGSLHNQNVPLIVDNSSKGKIIIQPENIVSLGQYIILVKLFGQHVRGSPVTAYAKASWSSVNTTNTLITGNKMESQKSGAWGMIQEEFGITPHLLTIKVDHLQTNKWAQVALYNFSSVKLKPGTTLQESIMSYNTYQKTNNATSVWKLQRENDGQISLLHDDNLIWKGTAPSCYVYVDIYNPVAIAEIIQ